MSGDLTNRPTEQTDSRRKAFSYAQAPPIPHSCDRKVKTSPIYALKEWGVPVDDTDDSVFSLVDLPEFKSTDFEYLLSFVGTRTRAQPLHVRPDGIDCSARTDNLPSIVDRKMLPPNDSERRPTKRRRLDNSFLHDIIPNVRIIFSQNNFSGFTNHCDI